MQDLPDSWNKDSNMTVIAGLALENNNFIYSDTAHIAGNGFSAMSLGY